MEWIKCTKNNLPEKCNDVFIIYIDSWNCDASLKYGKAHLFDFYNVKKFWCDDMFLNIKDVKYYMIPELPKGAKLK